MRRNLSLCTLSLLVLILASSARGQVHVLTQHNDKYRTGANLQEMSLSTSNVNPTRFGKLFARAVDGQIYAQPLYVSNLEIPGQGAHNVIFVATEHNSVYAFDADDPNQPEPLWKINLGPSVVVPNDEFGNRYGPYHDLLPELGITGTPAIDLNTKTLYVVAFTKERSLYYQRLHALDITTGAPKPGSPVEIRGSVPGTGYDQVGGRIYFSAVQGLQRPGLLLVGNVLYIAFASHADTDPYHGWVFAYNATTLEQIGIYCTTPDGREGGIWQSNQGLVADDEGDVYFMTGNGSFNANRDDGTGRNYGTSFVKLHLSETGLSVADWFSPCNNCCLDRSDADLGSAGPLILPGTRLLLGGGKQGVLYLMDKDRMGRFLGGQIGSSCPQAECNICLDDQIRQRFRATTGAIHGSPVFWDGPDGPTIYVMGSGDRVKSYRMRNGRFETTIASQSSVFSQFAGGPISLSANGGQAGTGIVWTTTSDGNNNPINRTGTFRAFDAADLSRELWNSRMNEALDGIGLVAKFNFPTIANGKVYMASFSGQLHVYGLLPANPPPLVNLTAPTPKTLLNGPAAVTVSASALSRDDSVTQVEFYAGDNLIGTAQSQPYRITWKDAPVGAHTLIAVATDRHGNTATSSPVEINVIAGGVAIDRLISIRFVGGGAGRPAFMLPEEEAGVIPRSIWNNAPNREIFPGDFKEGWLNRLFDDAGALTTARLAWTSNGVFNTGIPEEPGNNRMMKGYLDTDNSTATHVTVYDLPDAFIQNGYDVYVYFDGANGSAARTGLYRIDQTRILATDAADTNFSGKFVEAVDGSEGNYIVFPGLKDERFVLEALAGTSTDGTRRAPVNAIQIVAHAAPAP